MSEVQRLIIEEDGQSYEIFIESKDKPNLPSTTPTGSGRPGEMGISPAVKLQQAQRMIRGYAMYALSAFKDFKGVQIEEVTLKFGIKIGTKAGIPYITEGQAESNLEISVKCKFPTSP
jgi:hypothetical protein